MGTLGAAEVVASASTCGIVTAPPRVPRWSSLPEKEPSGT